MDDSSISSSSDDFPTPQGNRWTSLRARNKTTGNGVSTLKAVPRARQATHVREEVTQRRLLFDGTSTVCSIDVDNTCDTTAEELNVPLESLRRMRERSRSGDGQPAFSASDALHEALGRVGDRAAPHAERSVIASTADAASSMTPQKDQQLIIEQQEARIRELVRVLQEASGEIRKERQLREKLRDENERLRNGRDGLASAALVEAKAENDRLAQEVRRLGVSEENFARSYQQKLESMHNALQHVEKIREEEAAEAVRNREQIDEMQKEIKQLREAAAKQHRTAYTKEANEDALLVERMKRALAPPPDPESMSVLIDSMVRELRRQWKEEDKELLLVKKGRNLYRYGDRKLNLQLVNGKLAYRVGGGHRDLLTFLESQERSHGMRVMVMP